MALGSKCTLMAGIGGFAVHLGFKDNDFYFVDTMVGANIHFGVRHAPEGFWLGGRFHNGWIRVTNDSDSLYIGTVKLLAGYTWIFKSRFSLGLGGGVQYFWLGATSKKAKDLLGSSLLPAGELTLGVAF